MDKKQLFDAIDGIDDSLIERSYRKPKKKKSHEWVWIVAAAAAVLLIVAATSRKFINNDSVASASGTTEQVQDSLEANDVTAAAPETAENKSPVVDLNTVVSGYICDQRSFNGGNARSYVTFDDKNFYCMCNLNFQNRAIDLQTGQVGHVCRDPGCRHFTTYTDCIDNDSYSNFIAVGDDLYYTSDNSLIRVSGDKTETIYTNNFYSTRAGEQAQTYNFKSYFVLGGIASYGSKLYIVGITCVMSYDVLTGEITEPVEISENSIWSLCCTGDRLYYLDSNNRFFSCRTDGSDICELGYDVTQLYSYEGAVYYTKLNEKRGLDLYRLDYIYGDPVKLIDDCYANFAINNGYIYYQHYKENDTTLYMYDMATGGINQFSIDYSSLSSGSRSYYEPVKSNFTEMIKDIRGGSVPNGIYDIFTSPHLDSVFVRDDYNRLVFVFKAGSTEYKVVDYNCFP